MEGVERDAERVPAALAASGQECCRVKAAASESVAGARCHNLGVIPPQRLKY